MILRQKINKRQRIKENQSVLAFYLTRIDTQENENQANNFILLKLP